MITQDKEARDRAHMRDLQVGLPARRAAVELLVAVLQKKQALDDLLGRSLEKGIMFDLPPRDRALVRAIVAASLRRKGQIDHVLDTFLERGMPEKSGTLYPILLSAAAQLIFLKTPPHAAIDLAVTLAQYDPRAKRYSKLANAMLRRVAAEGETIASGLDATRVNTPDWLWSRWVTYWGEERAHAIGAAHLIEPPLDLTVKGDPELWAERLSADAADGKHPASAQGAHRGNVRVRRGRVVGTGCRRLPACAPDGRCGRQTRGRSLRGARRQDGAARARRR